MPTRSQAVVICSCGWKIGNVDRIALFEEAADIERGILAASVPRMVRHHELGHTFQLGERAPREFLAVVAAAARAVRDQREAQGSAGDSHAVTETALVRR